MVISSPTAFAEAVVAHPFGDFLLEPAEISRARSAVADSGLLVVGEPHGVRETPSVLYTLASNVGARAIALEWSHEEMDPSVQAFLCDGSFDFDLLWSLSGTAEFFCGDGRIAAGHFALLERLRREGHVDQVIVFDRLDSEPSTVDWSVRDREMAGRLLAEWDRRLPLLVLTGAFHAQQESMEGATMVMHLARELPGLQPAMLDYACGHAWSRGQLHDVSGAMPEAPITLRLPEATPALVPGAAN